MTIRSREPVIRQKSRGHGQRLSRRLSVPSPSRITALALVVTATIAAIPSTFRAGSLAWSVPLAVVGAAIAIAMTPTAIRSRPGTGSLPRPVTLAGVSRTPLLMATIRIRPIGRMRWGCRVTRRLVVARWRVVTRRWRYVVVLSIPRRRPIALFVVDRRRRRIHLRAVVSGASRVRHATVKRQAKQSSKQDSTIHGGLLDRERAQPATLVGGNRLTPTDTDTTRKCPTSARLVQLSDSLQRVAISPVATANERLFSGRATRMLASKSRRRNRHAA